MNEEASGTGQAISTQPTSQQSKVQVLTRGENSGPLGGNRAGQALSAHPTSPRPCFRPADHIDTLPPENWAKRTIQNISKEAKFTLKRE